jgi:signal transduction histidine kinase
MIVSRQLIPPDSGIAHLLQALDDAGHTPVICLSSENHLLGFNTRAQIEFAFSAEMLDEELDASHPVIGIIERLKPMHIVFGDTDVLAFAIESVDQHSVNNMQIITHDLRSPITAMQGYLHMLEMGVAGTLTESQAEFVEKIDSCIYELTRYIDNLQDASRFDPINGEYEMSRGLVDLNEVVGQCVLARSTDAVKIGIHIQFDAHPELPILNLDLLMIERAIAQLLDNALKYSPHGSTVNVSTHLNESSVSVEVSDRGYGIEPKHFQAVFEPHVRLKAPHSRHVKGTGLGLYIVQHVATQHHGQITLSSTPNRGSTFTLTIPLTPENRLFG